MSEEKKQLNEEQLEKVSGGGDWAEEMFEYLPSTHGKYIGKYEASSYIGQMVYIVMDADPKTYFWGSLSNSYEKELQMKGSTPWTERTHVIFLYGCSTGATANNGTNVEFSGDDYTLFLYN